MCQSTRRRALSRAAGSAWALPWGAGRGTRLRGRRSFLARRHSPLEANKGANRPCACVERMPSEISARCCNRSLRPWLSRLRYVQQSARRQASPIRGCSSPPQSPCATCRRGVQVITRAAQSETHRLFTHDIRSDVPGHRLGRRAADRRCLGRPNPASTCARALCRRRVWNFLGVSSAERSRAKHMLSTYRVQCDWRECWYGIAKDIEEKKKISRATRASC